jgi:hypothetical protein
MPDARPADLLARTFEVIKISPSLKRRGLQRKTPNRKNKMKVSFSKTEAAPAAPAVNPEGAAVTPAAPVVEAAQPVAPTPAATPAAPVAAEPTPATTATPVMVVTSDAGLAVAVTQPMPVGKPAAFYDDETLESTDLVLPRFSVVQKVGELSTVFPPGTVVLNGQLVLCPAGKAMEKSTECRILVVGFQPTIFVEKVEGGGRGNFYRTEAEVVQSGGSLDWNESKSRKIPLYQRSATAMILVEQLAGLDAAAFPNVIAGKNYALALYTMKGTAYTNGARHIKSARKVGHLKDGYRTGWFKFQSQLKKFGENYAYIPVVNADGASTPELRDGLLNLLGF